MDKKKIIIIIMIIFCCCISSIGGTIGGLYATKQNCEISEWTECINGKQTRKITKEATIFGECKEKENLMKDCIMPKFMIGDTKQTENAPDIAGSTIALTKHNIDCGNNVINQMKLTRKDNKFPGEIHYDYTCSTSNNDIGNNINKNTDFKWEGDMKSPFYSETSRLTEHNIDCGNKGVLTSMQLESKDGKMRYNYNCKYANKELKCRDVSTPINAYGNGNVIFLDRHDVRCNNNEVLSQVKLINDPNGIGYTYRCCSY